MSQKYLLPTHVIFLILLSLLFQATCANEERPSEFSRNFEYCNPRMGGSSYCETNEYCVPSLSKCKQKCKPDMRSCSFGSELFDCVCPAQQFCIKDGETDNFYCTDELAVVCDTDEDCAISDTSFCGDFICRNGRCQVVFDAATQTGIDCNDKDPCTINDNCNVKGYCVGEPKPCHEMDNQCNVGICTDGICELQARENNVACNDGLYCTTGDKCLDGLCVGSDMPPCKTSAECQVAICKEATESEKASCSTSPVNNGITCQDGIGCTVNDVCTEGMCMGQPDDSKCPERTGFTVHCKKPDGCVYEEIPVIPDSDPKDIIEKDIISDTSNNDLQNQDDHGNDHGSDKDALSDLIAADSDEDSTAADLTNDNGSNDIFPDDFIDIVTEGIESR